jgi:hypothetical protein
MEIPMNRSTVRIPLFLALLALIPLIPRLAAAQQTPEQAAERYFAATKAMDWTATAAMMHPQALQSMKTMFVELATLDSEGAVIPPMLGVQSGEQLAAMPPARVYERVLNMLTRLQPQTIEAMRGASFDVVGHVMEGDTAHVVYRLKMSVEGTTITQTSVFSLARDGGQWRGLLTGDIQNMISGLRSAIKGGGGGQ